MYIFENIQQKTKEWYEIRNNMITASNMAKTLNESKYGDYNDVIYEKLTNKKYESNINLHHGNKYEKIAEKLYQTIFNTKLQETNLIRHRDYNFLGASPDGINMKITLDNNINPKFCDLIEIKCPVTRKINTIGMIDDEICPHDYWVQIQIQLECCDLDLCDFWQCNIKEYTKLNKIFNDKNSIIVINNITDNLCIETNDKIIDDKIYFGVIIQIKPKIINDINDINKTKSDKNHKLNCKYLYPNEIFNDINMYNEWAEYQKHNFKFLYPELKENWDFDKILYWKLINAFNIPIKRDKLWFSDKIHIIKEVWNKIEILRQNNIMKNEFIKQIENKQCNKFKSTNEKKFNVFIDQSITTDKNIF